MRMQSGKLFRNLILFIILGGAITLLPQPSHAGKLMKHVKRWARQTVPYGKKVLLGAFRRHVRKMEKAGYRINSRYGGIFPGLWGSVEARTIAPGAGKKSFTFRAVSSNFLVSRRAALDPLTATTRTKDGKQTFERTMNVADGKIQIYKHKFQASGRNASRLKKLALDQYDKPAGKEGYQQALDKSLRQGAEVTYKYKKVGKRFRPVSASFLVDRSKVEVSLPSAK